MLECLRTFYRNEPFVKIVDHLPGSKDTANTNFCHITARVTGGRVLVFSALDNLIKGASGAAVQNFNLMFGFEETTATFVVDLIKCLPSLKAFVLPAFIAGSSAMPTGTTARLSFPIFRPWRLECIPRTWYLRRRLRSIDHERQEMPFRAVAINSGNANACTGERGLRDAERMAELAAKACGASGEQALVLSTGVIGDYLPLEKIAHGIEMCAARLAVSEQAFVDAARGMMTTDTVHKVASRTISLGGRTILIAGMCKGAAMIAPNMGTMLGLIVTDAPLTPASAQQSLSRVVEESFNCVSVDGHMSTNDTVLLLANGAAGGPSLTGDELVEFRTRSA